MRILEIGELSLINQVLPQITTQVLTSRHPYVLGKDTSKAFSLPVLARTFAALQRNKYDLVVCHAASAPLWRSDRNFLANLRQQIRYVYPDFRKLGINLLRIPLKAPLTALDFSDYPLIEPQNYWLLDKCRFYFKRELPLDVKKAFLPGLSKNSEFIERNLHKIKPISIGLSKSRVDDLPPTPLPKITDVFFAGTLKHSTVRTRGWIQLKRLAEKGYKIDAPENPIPRVEFLRRAAQAWLVWSPEGMGWDCFRHYEAAAARSVPVINRTTIQNYKPLRNGEHCFYYNGEGENLTETITDALRQRDRLREMGEAGRTHVLSNLTHAALCDYILKTSLPDAEMQHWTSAN